MLTIELLAPDRPMLRYPAKEVILPGMAGVMTIEPGHTPLLTPLEAGVVIIYEPDGKKHFYAQTGGFAEIKDNQITLLLEVFEHGQEIDLKRAEEARARAESHIKRGQADSDVARAEYALARALARIQAHQGEEY